MIAVVGEALVDVVMAADGAVTARSGGAPFNAARACARLGAPVSLVAAISADRFGRRLMADLTVDGVHTDHVQRNGAPTTLAVVELDAVGTATYRFYLPGTSAVALAPVPLPTGTRAVVAGRLGLAVEPMATAVERIVLDAGEDVLVPLDLNCRPCRRHRAEGRRSTAPPRAAVRLGTRLSERRSNSPRRRPQSP
ncbi:MAG: PfkB family carbohydrate kinase [Acidimicrobiales bacterium]